MSEILTLGLVDDDLWEHSYPITVPAAATALPAAATALPAAPDVPRFIFLSNSQIADKVEALKNPNTHRSTIYAERMYDSWRTARDEALKIVTAPISPTRPSVTSRPISRISCTKRGARTARATLRRLCARS